MAFINPVVVEGARFAIRQAASTALASTAEVISQAASTPSVISPTSANPPPTTHASLTSAVASPTDSSTLVNGGANPGGGGNGGNNNSNGGGGNSSSLLFFVALGFGVVFTNLWIIVGVKYCFRYNARNRQMRSEDGEINMENVPRPHRRRREKKLMPIDEVNEKFPMLKYKTWVASRAQEGLPTQGGVSAPPSRPNSIRDADGVVPAMSSKDVISPDDQPTTSATATEPTTAPGDPEKAPVQTPQHAPKESTSSTVGGFEGHSPPPNLSAARISADSNRDADITVAHKRFSEVSHDEDDDDEHIDAALPPECLGTSGDTCAICIDTLEDDDDVRGLTCGHAFHAVCIDPWLTTRRACCPLCKADYYTPKPRPQAAEGVDGTTGVIHVTLPSDPRGNNRMNLPSRPRHAWFSFGRMNRGGPMNQYTSSGRRTVGESQTRDDGHSSSLAYSGSRTGSGPSPQSPGSTGLLSVFRTALPGLRLARGRNNQDQSGPVASGASPTATTPSQLEAGIRNPQS
ncbi:uncharacterized protein B0T15DRAFT_17945 [Chaetomium strumarium]|uniref:RING-type E3 ubiquitin transferase n=1 Tax=Chaetomium strumarium TaxID=1170767 RepID=A0AAJ0H156_9PEZI|nr:hypothetical protein B0T15DRAFT_17945 [Chaetomium strumarium]